jgi:hypothetical protein
MRGKKTVGCVNAPDGWVCLMVEHRYGSFIMNARMTRGYDNPYKVVTSTCHYTARVTITDPGGGVQYDWDETSRKNSCTRGIPFLDFWINKPVPDGSRICGTWVDNSTSGVTPCLRVDTRMLQW